MAAARGIAVAALLRDVDTIVHGTTLTTNATLPGDGAKTGFVTTAGFRDVLNMRRGLKERQFEKYAAPPLPLIPRHLVRVVEERVDYAGTVLTPLKEDDVHAAADYFREHIVNHNIAAAIEVVSVQRGYDPREFVLVVAGGGWRRTDACRRAGARTPHSAPVNSA